MGLSIDILILEPIIGSWISTHLYFSLTTSRFCPQYQLQVKILHLSELVTHLLAGNIEDIPLVCGCMGSQFLLFPAGEKRNLYKKNWQIQILAGIWKGKNAIRINSYQGI